MPPSTLSLFTSVPGTFMGFAPVTNRDDVDKLALIIDRINYPILADPNTLEMALTLQFAAVSGTWFSRQRFDRRHDPLDEACIQRLQTLCGPSAQTCWYTQPLSLPCLWKRFLTESSVSLGSFARKRAVRLS